jgi:hypothetical protein
MDRATGGLAYHHESMSIPSYRFWKYGMYS